MPRRIVSLLPSSTELVCLVGAGDRLVGRSHECDWPAEILDRPVLTRPRTDLASGGARGVDEQVGAALARHESLYELDEALLADLEPDLIITQDLCGVCSIDLAAVRRAAEQLGRRRGQPVEVLCLNPTTLEGVLDDVLRVGKAVGEPARALDELMGLRTRLIRAQECVSPYAAQPSVGLLEWTDPLFVAGHWTVQLIERAGGRHPLNETRAMPDAGAGAGLAQSMRRAGPAIRVTPEALAASEPQWLVVCPCGLTLEQTRREVDRLADRPWWGGLPAVGNGCVALVDGSRFFNRPGPRLVDAFEWLVGWLNDRPELIADDFIWERWPAR